MQLHAAVKPLQPCLGLLCNLTLVLTQVVEAFQPQALFGSGACLEVYGKVASAPDLRFGMTDSESEAAGISKGEALVGGRPEFGGDERLAECLATPFTGEESCDCQPAR